MSSIYNLSRPCSPNYSLTYWHYRIFLLYQKLHLHKWVISSIWRSHQYFPYSYTHLKLSNSDNLAYYHYHIVLPYLKFHLHKLPIFHRLKYHRNFQYRYTLWKWNSSYSQYHTILLTRKYRHHILWYKET